MDGLAEGTLCGDMVFGDKTDELVAVQMLAMTGLAVAGYAAAGVAGVPTEGQ